MLYSRAGAGSSIRGVCPESSVVSLSTTESGCPVTEMVTEAPGTGICPRLEVRLIFRPPA